MRAQFGSKALQTLTHDSAYLPDAHAGSQRALVAVYVQSRQGEPGERVQVCVPARCPGSHVRPYALTREQGPG